MIEIQLTADGSHTLFVPELDEHYHSVNGAIQESEHVYVQAGFNACLKEEISVLELGFGTGLNALLTCLEAKKRNVSVHYTGLEKYPLSQEIWSQLNYAQAINPLALQTFDKIHASEWGEMQSISPTFFLQKLEVDFQSFDFPGHYDVVYYDAFAPDKQPEVWTQELFDRLYASMNPSGILTTYCAKGNIRRMMLHSGFSVERIPGPPGKRQMMRAVKMSG